jgi:2-polyprenyl-6-methoxyphenol hydroxylase-like FAD-dependent oxidoreductase
MVNPLPPFFADQSPRPIDDKLWTYTARRPAGEWVFADAARREPRVTVRRGVQAAGLITGASALAGTPHVVGVRTDDGEEIRADVVIDAMGRRSRAPAWLAAIGARPPYEEQADCGFTYEPPRIGPVFMPLGTIAILTLPGDNRTWSITLLTSSVDTPLRNLRQPEQWTSVVGAFLLQAHWLDGTPITDIAAMSGIVDRYRRFVVDGSPVATGFLAVADAWACTNPSAGRGLTVGFMHAVRLRDAMREEMRLRTCWACRSFRKLADAPRSSTSPTGRRGPHRPTHQLGRSVGHGRASSGRRWHCGQCDIWRQPHTRMSGCPAVWCTCTASAHPASQAALSSSFAPWKDAGFGSTSRCASRAA